MRFSVFIKEVIATKLGLEFETISNMSSEELDAHIEKSIVKKPLKIKPVGSKLIPSRGIILPLISRSVIDKRIDRLLKR